MKERRWSEAQKWWALTVMKTGRSKQRLKERQLWYRITRLGSKVKPVARSAQGEVTGETREKRFILTKHSLQTGNTKRRSEVYIYRQHLEIYTWKTNTGWDT